MEWIRQRLDKMKQPFSKGEKYEKYAPAVNALDTFLFTPNHTTQKGAHIRDAVDLKRTMITVVIALIPALLFGPCRGSLVKTENNYAKALPRSL